MPEPLEEILKFELKLEVTERRYQTVKHLWILESHPLNQVVLLRLSGDTVPWIRGNFSEQLGACGEAH